MIRSIALILAGMAGIAPLAAHAAEDICRTRSAEILHALQKGDYAAATAHFDERGKAAITPEKLGQIWRQMLPAKFGAFDHAAATQVRGKGDVTIAEIPLQFANGWLTMQVTCVADGKVGGLFFLPGHAPEADQAMPHAGVPGVIERPLSVSSPLGPLPGTLALPAGDGPFPAVLLLAGSGAHDRDETIGPNKPLRDVAEGLAAAGIASLRYDKRTRVYGQEMAARPNGTIDDEVTDDALAALHLLGEQPKIDGRRLFVLGHSLGALMAPRIGKRDPRLAGLILLAAPARPLLEVSAEQVREQGQRQGLTPAQMAASEQAIEAEQALLAKADPRHPPQGSFGHAPHSYWLSLRDYDPLAVAKALPLPMLVLQGDGDFQVSPANDFALWQQALAGQPRASFHRYAGLSHLFMPAGKTQTIADYQALGHVDARVIHDIVAWVGAQPPR